MTIDLICNYSGLEMYGKLVSSSFVECYLCCAWHPRQSTWAVMFRSFKSSRFPCQSLTLMQSWELHYCSCDIPFKKCMGCAFKYQRGFLTLSHFLVFFSLLAWSRKPECVYIFIFCFFLPSQFLISLILIYMEYLVCWNLLLLGYAFLLILLHKIQNQAIKAYLIIQSRETLFLRRPQIFIERKSVKAFKCILWSKCLILVF